MTELEERRQRILEELATRRFGPYVEPRRVIAPQHAADSTSPLLSMLNPLSPFFPRV